MAALLVPTQPALTVIAKGFLEVSSVAKFHYEHEIVLGNTSPVELDQVAVP